MALQLAGEACNVHDFILSASALSSSTLDLSRKGITKLPEDLPGYKTLEALYLEGNRLITLPESLFISCPNLRWLDLRNNKLQVLPPSIEKLKFLRALLLEGNQLVSLPPQLSRLSHLSGLNISHNPLQDPPKEITEQGVKAVLNYLREMLDDEEERRTCSTDSTSSLPDSRQEKRSHISLKPIANSSKDKKTHWQSKSLQKIERSIVLPSPIMKQATLHSQSPTRHKHYQPPSPLSTKKKNFKPNTMHAKKQIHQKTKEEKAQINNSLEKLKSQQGLEGWRKQAKLMQKQKEQELKAEDHTSFLTVLDTAPFATFESPTLKDEQRRTRHDRAREMGTLSMERRIEKYMMQLKDRREQVGIISSPSSQLTEAERHLAEAIALQEELKKAKPRDYRLTAFTGDSH